MIERESEFTHRRLFWLNRLSLIKGGVSLIFLDLTIFSLPLLIKGIIDHLSGRPLPTWIPKIWQDAPTMTFIISAGCIYLAANAIIAWLRYWWRVLLIWSTFPVFHQVRRKIFQKVQYLDREFFTKTSAGNLISILSADTENLRMTLSIGSLMIIDTIIYFVLFPIALWHLNSELCLWVVPPLLAVSIGTLFLSKRLSIYYERVQDLSGDLSARAVEIASGIRVIKAFRKENNIHSDFVKMSRDLRDVSKQVAKFQSLFSPLLEYSLSLATIGVLIFGGYQVLQGKMLLSNLIAFQLYLSHMDWPMNAMGWFIQLFRTSKASLRRIQEVECARNPLVRLCDSPKIQTSTLISAQDIEFSFESSRRFSMKNISFDLKPGEWLGLTGPVGCGKTSLLELLSRQRDPQSGNIFFKGESLKGMSPDEVASRILYVPQEAFMFSRSIRRNLGLGLENEISDDELWKVILDLSFDEKGMSERGGLDIRLGEKGVNLSGGQRQRISLGRALVRPRDVYLLDDLFSHIDVETEFKLLSIVERRIPRSAGMILVSQRLETLKRCQEVLVLESGKLSYHGDLERGLRESKFLRGLQELQSQQEAAV